MPRALTSYGGLELLGRYLRRNDLVARLRQTFAGLRSDYGSPRIALVLLALFYVGARRLEHLRYLGGDPMVTRFCGLARLPTRRTVADWLRQFTQETLAPLVALNGDLMTDALARLEPPRLTIDVDGSVIRTGATVGWAFRGFNPHHRKDPSYYPLGRARGPDRAHPSPQESARQRPRLQTGNPVKNPFWACTRKMAPSMIAAIPAKVFSCPPRPQAKGPQRREPQRQVRGHGGVLVVPVIRGEQIELEVATRFVIDVLPVQPNAQAQVVSTVGMLSSVS